MKKLIIIPLLLISSLLFSQTQLGIDIYGIWKSSSGAKFQIINTEEGFKICNIKYRNSWSYFKKDDTNSFVAFKVDGNNYSQRFIGSKITIQDSSNIIVYNNEDSKNYYWTKQQDYRTNESGSTIKSNTEEVAYYPDQRIMVAVSNYNFQGGSAELDEMSRFTLLLVDGNQHDGLSFSSEIVFSLGSYSLDEPGVQVYYEDGLLGYAIGGIIGTDGDFASFYLRGVGGLMYQWGEIKTIINSESTIEKLGNFGFYYNAAIGCDIYLSEGFGITVEAGISKIPIISIGIIF